MRTFVLRLRNTLRHGWMGEFLVRWCRACAACALLRKTRTTDTIRHSEMGQFFARWRGAGAVCALLRNTRTTDTLRHGWMGEFLVRWCRACAACALLRKTRTTDTIRHREMGQFFARWRGAGAVCALVALEVGWAHDAPTTKLTWTREISRMVTQRCVGCHQPGGAAPFSLRTYAEARPWAVAIKEEVLQRRMPPWPAAKGFGEFSNDISLPQEEINRLAEWAEGGAPEGEAQYLRPVFSVPIWRAATRPAGRAFRLQGRLMEGVTVLAVRGAGAGKSWAELADGSVAPLAWLTGAGKGQWMILREPVRLPAGALIRGIALDGWVR